MGAYLVRRFGLMLITLFGISIIIFMLLRLTPGNIADILFDAGGFVDPTDKARIEAELGLDKLVDQQSTEADAEKRKRIVWEIERKLAEDGARPAIFYPVSAACWQPYFKGHTMMVNGNYNGWRLEDAWLDR